MLCYIARIHSTDATTTSAQVKSSVKHADAQGTYVHMYVCMCMYIPEFVKVLLGKILICKASM